MPMPSPRDLLADIDRIAKDGNLQNYKDELFLKCLAHIACQMEEIEGSLTMLANSVESNLSQLANEVGEVSIALCDAK